MAAVEVGVEVAASLAETWDLYFDESRWRSWVELLCWPPRTRRGPLLAHTDARKCVRIRRRNHGAADRVRARRDGGQTRGRGWKDT